MILLVGIFAFLLLLLLAGYVFFWWFSKKIEQRELRIISLFSSRSDALCQIYELTRNELGKHEQIFQEILELRKREFAVLWVSHNMLAFLSLQSSMHHEINFIFQICNKNPKLLHSKRFLYARENILEKSAHIRESMEEYKKILLLYNSCIRFKKYSVFWFLLPYHNKEIFQ